ncbi:MAG: SRPBCC family protein [Iamia sp.]
MSKPGRSGSSRSTRWCGLAATVRGGTTRDIKGPTGTTSEEFFAWEDGRRMSFHFSRGAVPGLDAFAEDYLLEPAGDDRCDLVWRYGFGFTGAFKVIQPGFAFGFKRVARRSLVKLADHLREHRSQHE